jgi:hypothetical protein
MPQLKGGVRQPSPSRFASSLIRSLDTHQDIYDATFQLTLQLMEQGSLLSENNESRCL